MAIGLGGTENLLILQADGAAGGGWRAGFDSESQEPDSRARQTDKTA